MMYTEFGKYADPLEKIQQAKSKTIFFINYALSRRVRYKFQQTVINTSEHKVQRRLQR